MEGKAEARHIYPSPVLEEAGCPTTPPLMFAVLLLLLILHQVEPALWGLIKLSQLLLNTGKQSVAESAWSCEVGWAGAAASLGWSEGGLRMRGRELGLAGGLWAGPRMLPPPPLCIERSQLPGELRPSCPHKGQRETSGSPGEILRALLPCSTLGLEFWNEYTR